MKKRFAGGCARSDPRQKKVHALVFIDIVTEYLPPYAPELNPVEYIWAYWKQHELPNVCPKDYG